MRTKLVQGIFCAVMIAAFSVSSFAADLTVWGIQTFNKATDSLIDQTLQDFAKEKGISAEYVVVPANYLNERLAAAIEGCNPPDIFMNVGESLQYYMSLGVTANVDDVMAELDGGRGVLDAVKPLLIYEGAYQAVPVEVDVVPMFARLDHLKKAGIDKIPETMEELRQACLAIKKARIVNYPLGLGVSNCNDSETTIRMIIWAHGGGLFSPDGKSAQLDTPETHAAMEFLVKVFKEDRTMSRSALTWDDSGNNTAWQTGTASFVVNSPSIYSWMAESNKEMLENSTMMVLPKGDGPKGRHANQVSAQSWMIARQSKNIPMAKDFLRHFYQDGNYSALIKSCGGRWLPIFPKMMDGMALFTETPQLAGFKDMSGRTVVMGLRPSAFALRKTVRDGGDLPVWRGTIEVLEMLGDSALAHVDVNGNSVTLVVSPHDLPEEESAALEFCPLMNRAHFFDTADGRNLTTGVKIPGRRSMRRPPRG